MAVENSTYTLGDVCDVLAGIAAVATLLSCAEPAEVDRTAVVG